MKLTKKEKKKEKQSSGSLSPDETGGQVKQIRVQKHTSGVHILPLDPSYHQFGGHFIPFHRYVGRPGCETSPSQLEPSHTYIDCSLHRYIVRFLHPFLCFFHFSIHVCWRYFASRILPSESRYCSICGWRCCIAEISYLLFGKARARLETDFKIWEPIART